MIGTVKWRYIFTSNLKKNVYICNVGDCPVTAYTINFPLIGALSIKHNYVEFETPSLPPFLLTQRMAASSRIVTDRRRVYFT
jgi:hypothetical protein